MRDRLVAEVADGAAVEQRQPGHWDRVVAAKFFLDHEQRIAVLVGERLDAVRLGADERVAADLLAALDGLEQEREGPAGDLEVRRDGRLEVGADLAVDRDDVPLARSGEGADVVEAGLRDAEGGGCHRMAPAVWPAWGRAASRYGEVVRHPPRAARRRNTARRRGVLVMHVSPSLAAGTPGPQRVAPNRVSKKKRPPPWGDGPRGATQFRAPPQNPWMGHGGARSSGHGRGTRKRSAMPWAWITAPTPSTPTGPLDRVDGGRSGRDSRVHSAAADRRRASTLPRLSGPRVAAYSSRSPSVRLYASGRDRGYVRGVRVSTRRARRVMTSRRPRRPVAQPRARYASNSS